MVLSYCAQEVKRDDFARYLAALCYPPAKREDVFALHAFDLETARAVQLAGKEKMSVVRLVWWRDMLDSLFGETAILPHPVAEALRQAIRRYGWERQAFERVLEARAEAIERLPEVPQDIEALKSEVLATAGVLGRLRLQLLGVEDMASQKAADRLAQAWGLMEQLRRPGGCAPAEIAAAAEALLEAENGESNSQLLPLMQEHRICRYYLRQFRRREGGGHPPLHPESSRPIGLMARLFLAQLAAVKCLS